MPYPITKTQFVDTQQIDAVDFILPFQEAEDALDELEAEITATTADLADVKSGVDAFPRLRFGDTTTLTIASGVITVTQSRHLVDTEGAASSDDLVTVSGTTSGGVLVIQIVSAARVVVIKHNTGNFFNATQADVTLNRPELMYLALFDTTLNKWIGGVIGLGGVSLREGFDSTLLSATSLRAPDNSVVNTGMFASVPILDVMPASFRRKRIEVRSNGNAFVASMGSITTLSGTLASAPQSDSSYTSMQTTTSSLNSTGWHTATDQIRGAWNPQIRAQLRNGGAGATSIATNGGTIYIGFTNTVNTSSVQPLVSHQYVLFRARNNAGSGEWTLMTANGSTGGGIAAQSYNMGDVIYSVALRWDGANGIAYVSVNDATELSINTNMPSTSTNMAAEFIVQNGSGSSGVITYFNIAEITFN